MTQLQCDPAGIRKHGRGPDGKAWRHCARIRDVMAGLLRLKGLIVPCIALVANVAAQTPPPPPSTVPTPVPPAQASSASAERGDPFTFRGTGGDDDGFVNVSQAVLPPGIRVAGILKPSGREPVGAIAIPGQASLHFVRTGDVIQIDSGSKNLSGTAQTGPVYLLIVSVTAEQIEIATRLRPQDARIYR